MKIPSNVVAILNEHLALLDTGLFEKIFRPLFDETGNIFLSLGSGEDRYLEWHPDYLWSEVDNEILMIAEEVLNEQ